jgi:hypothetical protein
MKQLVPQINEFHDALMSIFATLKTYIKQLLLPIFHMLLLSIPKQQPKFRDRDGNIPLNY